MINALRFILAMLCATFGMVIIGLLLDYPPDVTDGVVIAAMVTILWRLEDLEKRL